MDSYNGYSAAERQKKYDEWKRLVQLGQQPYSSAACDMCSRAAVDTKLEPHSEDYSKPYKWTPPHEYMLCRPCHMWLHKRFNKPHDWEAFQHHVRRGGHGYEFAQPQFRFDRQAFKEDKSHQWPAIPNRLVKTGKGWWEHLTVATAEPETGADTKAGEQTGQEMPITVPGLSEHDLDLLVLEELVASEAFATWLLSHATNTTGRLVAAHNSVVHRNGESDLELTFVAAAGTNILLLVENKIDASLQPLQVERYQERANEYRKTNRYAEVLTVLIAPSSYCSGVKGKPDFDRFITYEQIRQWFEAQENMGRRLLYKLALLDKAIDRGKRGWLLQPNAAAKLFWDGYHTLASSLASELQMPRPKAQIPFESHFIEFKPPLPAGVTLLHKVEYGHVDLQFSGAAKDLLGFDARLRPYLQPGMEIHRAGKSAVVRTAVDPLTLWPSFEVVRPQATAAIEAAKTLLKWYRNLENRSGASERLLEAKAKGIVT